MPVLFIFWIDQSSQIHPLFTRRNSVVVRVGERRSETIGKDITFLRQCPLCLRTPRSVDGHGHGTHVAYGLFR